MRSNFKVLKIGTVNSQTAEKSWSRFSPAIAIVARLYGSDLPLLQATIHLSQQNVLFSLYERVVKIGLSFETHISAFH